MQYTHRATEALVLTHELHANQTRKGSEVPYVTHLLAVASIVGEYGGDEDQFIASLLHDAAEDQGGPEMLERIRAQFGDRVANLVLEASDTLDTPKPPWRPRKEKHIAAIRKASPDIKLIVAADKLHNGLSILRDLRIYGPCVWDRFTGKQTGTCWYYEAMCEALTNGWSHPILDELNDVIKHMKAMD